MRGWRWRADGVGVEGVGGEGGGRSGCGAGGGGGLALLWDARAGKETGGGVRYCRIVGARSPGGVGVYQTGGGWWV